MSDEELAALVAALAAVATVEPPQGGLPDPMPAWRRAMRIESVESPWP